MTRPSGSSYDYGYGYDSGSGTDRQGGRDRDYDVRDRADRVASEAGDFLETSLREHPLLLGLGAALLGAVAGALIPNSPHEHRAMGEQRNRLVDAGLRYGRQAAEDALAGAERAIDAAVEEFMAEVGAGSADDADDDDDANAAGSGGDATDADAGSDTDPEERGSA